MNGQKNITNPIENLIAEKVGIKLKRPRLYKVILVNDDYTPMEFVVRVLEYFFSMPEDKAISVMFQVHYTGSAICGVYTRDIAETKVAQVNEYAQNNEHPLLCCMEVA